MPLNYINWNHVRRETETRTWIMWYAHSVVEGIKSKLSCFASGMYTEGLCPWNQFFQIRSVHIFWAKLVMHSQCYRMQLSRIRTRSVSKTSSSCSMGGNLHVSPNLRTSSRKTVRVSFLLSASLRPNWNWNWTWIKLEDKTLSPACQTHYTIPPHRSFYIQEILIVLFFCFPFIKGRPPVAALTLYDAYRIKCLLLHFLNFGVECKKFP